MAAPMKSVTDQVELGFVEESETFLLKSRFFPSKIGGMPAWLSLSPVPKPEHLSCRVCGKPSCFLLQVYSPDEEKSETFHRTFFLFVCADPACCKLNSSANFHVFRSQLPRDNDFYSSDPPQEVPLQEEPDASQFQSLCVVCGCCGPKACGKCHRASYCSKEHQTIDWKAGHKKSCGTEDKEERSHNNVLFPERELITEMEELPSETPDKTDRDKLKEYKEFLKSNVEKGCTQVENMTESELEKMASKETENDKQLRKFKKRISHQQEQVLRYDKGGTPLWIAHEPKPSNIPDCSCGAKRQFEFQILPQLLSHLNVDKLEASLDWGTLCVYTCSKSCSIGNDYVEEYIFKQDIS